VNIYDFDGTIAESNLLKTDAFRYCAKDFGEDISEWFVEFHKANGGITRQVKIQTLCEKVNRMDLYEELLTRYEEYLSSEWLNCPLISGFREHITQQDGMNLILSGGAKTEIEAYLKHNKLDAYFIEVFGNPIDKQVNLQTIKEKYLSNSNDIYFYGDSRLDFELSKKVDGKFVFLSKVSEWVDSHLFKEEFFLELYDYVARW